MNTLRSLLLVLLASLSLTITGRSWTPDELPDVTNRVTKVINPDHIL